MSIQASARPSSQLPRRHRRLVFVLLFAASVMGASVYLGRATQRRLLHGEYCDDSSLAALAIARRVAARVLILRQHFPSITDLDPSRAVHFLPAEEIDEQARAESGEGPPIGSVLYERGSSPDTSHCRLLLLCHVRKHFAPGGIYLWVDFYTDPHLDQVERDDIAIGPLRIHTHVDGADPAEANRLHFAIDRAVEEERAARSRECAKHKR